MNCIQYECWTYEETGQKKESTNMRTPRIPQLLSNSLPLIIPNITLEPAFEQPVNGPSF